METDLLKYTPIEAIAPTVKRLRNTFNTHKTKSKEWRVRNLNALKQACLENKDDLTLAVQKDLHQDLLFATNEAIGVVEIIDDALAQLSEWMDPINEWAPVLTLPASTTRYKDPLGVVLLISPWNFPISLVTRVLVGIIAAGNCCVIKPSEVSANTAAALGRILMKYLDPECFAFVQGGVEETTELLKYKFDLIQYTGGGPVAKIIMKAAANFLTPCLFELGGKCPTVIDKDVDLDVAVPRIIWGKFANAGQICIAPDYVLIDKSREKEFIEKAKATIEKFYTKSPQDSADYARIINSRHTQRLADLLPGGTVVHGGVVDVQNRFISPTLLTNVDLNSKLMQDEIFGPLLPIIPIDSIDQAINFINERPKPLSCYVFTSNYAHSEKIFKLTSSGGGCINEVIFHNICPNLRFGGVGESGMGGYNGKHSFDAFTHEKGVLVKGLKPDIALRFPPFTPEKVNRMQFLGRIGAKLPSAKTLVLGGFVVSILAAYYFLRGSGVEIHYKF